MCLHIQTDEYGSIDSAERATSSACYINLQKINIPLFYHFKCSKYSNIYVIPIFLKDLLIEHVPLVEGVFYTLIVTTFLL